MTGARDAGGAERAGFIAAASIDTERASESMRARIIDRAARRLLITDLRGSSQEKDLTLPTNCGGVGRVRHFRRATHPGWPSNPLPIDPACQALGIQAPDVVQAQVFQNAGCNWRCWYCFVPYDRLAGDPARSVWLTADELVERFLAEEQRPRVIDLSGGQPDLVPEWTIWMLDALEAHGLTGKVYLWSDDNLSADYFFRYLTDDERARLAACSAYGRVGCFKGFDETSFAFNTRAEPHWFERQFALMDRLLGEGLDVYAYVTLTTPVAAGIRDGVARFFDRLQRIDARLPLRTIPLRIETFTPVRQRMNDVHQNAIDNQERAVEAWQAEREARFTAAERALNVVDAMARRSR